MKIDFQFQFISLDTAVYKSKILWNNFIKQKPAQSRFNDTRYNTSIRLSPRNTNFNTGMKCQRFILISQNRFIHTFKYLTFTKYAWSLLRQVIDTQHHILRRNRHRAAV